VPALVTLITAAGGGDSGGAASASDHVAWGCDSRDWYLRDPQV